MVSSVAETRVREQMRAPAATRLDFRSEMSRLYFAIEAARTGQQALILQFVGVTGGEGVSTLAAAFARRCAREPRTSILLVACGEEERHVQPDLGTLPSVLDLFQSGRPLAGAGAPSRGEEAEPGIDRLHRAILGKEARDELNPRMLAALADALRRTYNVVVLDCPPATRSPIAGILSRVADGTIIVAAAGVSRRRAMERAVAAISSMGGVVVGFVLNRRREWLPAWLRQRLA